MNLSRTGNTIYNTAIGLLYLVAHTLYSFVLTGIIINSFGSESNGLISSIKQILTYAALVDMGLGAACIMSYYGPLSRCCKEEIKNVYLKSKRFFYWVGTAYLGVLLILSTIYPLIVKTSYSKPYITSVFLTIGFGRCFSFFAIEKYKCIFTADQKNRIEQICLLLSDVLSIVIVFLLVKIGVLNSILKIEMLISGLTIIQYFYYRIVFKKCYPWILSKEIVPLEEKNPIKQIKATFVHTISSTISYNTDIILLTIFRSLSEVSIYSVYSMVMAMANSFFSACTKGVESSFGNLFNKDQLHFKKVFSRFEYGFVIIDSIIVCTVLLLLNPFLELYTKAETEFSYWNFSVVISFVVITFFNNIRNPHAMVIRISENYNSTQGIFVMEAIINLSVSLLFVQFFGIIGVLFGTLFSVLIRNVYVIRFVYKIVLRESVIPLIREIVVNCIPVLICSFFALHPILGYCSNYFSLFLNAIAYGVCAILVVVLVNIVLNTKQFLDLMRNVQGVARKILFRS